MRIIVGKNAGFCYGVKNAVDKSIEALNEKKEICCLGEIVHNKAVVKDLELKGMKFIESLNENTQKNKTVIRAHGVDKLTYDYARNNEIELLDLTCPNVLKIHKIAEEHEKNGYYIFVIGNKCHPETIGTVGFCGENYSIIETENDIEIGIEELKKSKISKLLIIVQTTFSLEKFIKFSEIIKRTLGDNILIEIVNTICNSTKLRQEETEKMSKEVDFMIIIGGKNSSNTKKLFEIASKYCTNAICVESYSEINKDLFKNCELVGIMAGASTPQSSIDEVVKFLL